MQQMPSTAAPQQVLSALALEPQQQPTASSALGTEPQQRGDCVGPQPVKPAQNPLAPLRREVALDVGDHENQEAQQHRDFDDIVEEKLDAAAPAGSRIQPQRGKAAADRGVQPLHAQNLILDKVPNTHK